MFDMFIGIATSLIATGIGVLVAWLWSRKKRDDEALARMNRIETSLQNLYEKFEILSVKIETLSEKFDNLREFVTLKLQDFEKERELREKRFDEERELREKRLDEERALLEKRFEEERELAREEASKERELIRQEFAKNRDQIVKEATLEAIKVLEANRATRQ